MARKGTGSKGSASLKDGGGPAIGKTEHARVKGGPGLEFVAARKKRGAVMSKSVPDEKLKAPATKQRSKPASK